jgi:hypothetical protein
MSDSEEPIPKVKVLIALYPGMDALNVLGPLEALNNALHNSSDPCKLMIFSSRDIT